MADNIVERLWGLLDDGTAPIVLTREDVRAVLAEMERFRNTLEIVVDMLEEDFPYTAQRYGIVALKNHL